MKKGKLLRRILPLLMALALVVPMFQPVAVTQVQAKPSKAEIEALKKNAADLDKQKKELQEKLKAVRADKYAALEKKDLIEGQMEVIQSEIDNCDDQIATMGDLITAKGEELVQTEAKEKAQYELFCKRVRNMEENGTLSYWSILFSSVSFSDLLDNFMMMDEIMAYDTAIMEQLQETRNQIEADKAEIEKAKAEQEAAREVQVKAKEELAASQAEVDKLIEEISGQEELLAAQEAKLRAEANSIDAELRQTEEQMKPQINNVPSESGFMWPLPGHYTLSSLFGSRIHPITGRPNNHTGIDIPAPGGTPIVAAKSGVVTKSLHKGSYGSYVVISHSDGTSTLYAHMSSRAVSQGQTVKQGQVIGYVGHTGSATGDHLHYEVRVGGNRRDPVDYYKSLTLYVGYGSRRKVLPH